MLQFCSYNNNYSSPKPDSIVITLLSLAYWRCVVLIYFAVSLHKNTQTLHFHALTARMAIVYRITSVET